MIEKKLFFFLLIFMLLSFFIINNNVLGEKESNKEISLLSIFPLREGYTWYYDGSLDTGNVSVIDKIIKKNGNIIINLKICREDRTGEQKIDNLISKNEYIVNSNEILHNGNVILKSPIIKGKQWEYIFKFNSLQQEGEAITIITEVDSNKITTKTIVKNVNGYKNNTYTEENIYEIGKGLIKKKYDVYMVEDFTMELWLVKIAKQPINKNKWYLRSNL